MTPQKSYWTRWSRWPPALTAWQAADNDSSAAAVSTTDPLIVDLDATLVTAHGDTKEAAAGNYKRGFGFHPLDSFVDHGTGGTGEPLSSLLRPGNAGSNTAADHISVTGDALQQLPAQYRTGVQTLIRTDSAGGTPDFLDWLTHPDRHLAHSVGFPFTEAITEACVVLRGSG